MVKLAVLIVLLMPFMYDVKSTADDPCFDAQATKDGSN
jgi:hypothetical protein